MKRPPPSSNYAVMIEEGRSSVELLVLPDGRILAHNITPALAALLAELDPAMRERAATLNAKTVNARPPASNIQRPIMHEHPDLSPTS